MLFVATHEHTPNVCPGMNPEPIVALTDEEHIRQSGVKVIHASVAPPEHTMFFVIEAEDYSQIVRYFRPMMMIGTPRIVPVQTFDEALAVLGPALPR
jgi:hypothetical protein